jgi:AcrR family transcriptional regulator
VPPNIRSDSPLRTDARRNRARLLDVAHAAFLERGVMASMDDIARQAGVGIGTLYRHFPTRDDLILALVADDLERLATLADELRAGGDVDAVEQWMRELIRHNLTYRGLAESIADAVTRHTALGAACDRIHDAGAALVRNAQDGGTIRADIDPHVAIDLAGAVAWSTQDDPDDERRRVLLGVTLDGLRSSTMR